MIIDSGCRVRMARFCRAEIRVGCCPGFESERVDFRVYLESSFIRCHRCLLFRALHFNYFFELRCHKRCKYKLVIIVVFLLCCLLFGLRDC